NTGRAKLGGRASAVMPTKTETKPVAQKSNDPAPNLEAKTAAINDDEIKSRWPEVVAGQKPIVRALYSAVSVVDCQDGMLTLAAPSEMHISKSNEHLQILLDSLKRVSGKQVSIKFVVAESKRGRTVKQPAPIDDESELVEDLSETVSTAGLADTTQFDELAKAFPGSQIIDDKK
ncbi:MAG: hypothetical protein ACKPAF_00500, partial [Actinomycetota bacterium]